MLLRQKFKINLSREFMCIPVKNTAVLEEDLLTTKLEETNKWYAIAKISGIRMCQAYIKEYKQLFTDYANNLYGPNDKYSGIDAHVIPAPRKICKCQN